MSSAEVMHFLHTLFTQFDSLVDSMEDVGLYKVETIGGMCAAAQAHGCRAQFWH